MTQIDIPLNGVLRVLTLLGCKECLPFDVRAREAAPREVTASDGLAAVRVKEWRRANGAALRDPGPPARKRAVRESLARPETQDPPRRPNHHFGGRLPLF
jgi:hypothetical protein